MGIGSSPGQTGGIGGQTFGGGGIIGFRPDVPKKSILVYKTKSKYNEWEFVYDPIIEQTTIPGGNNGGNMGQNGLNGTSNGLNGNGVVGLGNNSSFGGGNNGSNGSSGGGSFGNNSNSGTGNSSGNGNSSGGNNSNPPSSPND
jgi:hypothetical protein